MGWRKALIKRHKADISYLHLCIDRMRADQGDLGKRSPARRLINLSNETIARYEQTIERLERLVTSLKAKDYLKADGPKGKKRSADESADISAEDQEILRLAHQATPEQRQAVLTLWRRP